MMLTAALLSIAAGPGCPVPAQEIPISARPLDGAALGGQAEPNSAGGYRIGAFAYRGHGLVVTFRDGPFGDLVLDQSFGLRHRCGNIVAGPSVWNAHDPNLGRWTLQIGAPPRQLEPAPGAVAAESRGVHPRLDGHVPGATWPIWTSAGSFFLGLMYPEGRSEETLLVAFRDEPGTAAPLVMARLPMRFETLSILPELHGPDSWVYLSSLREGRLTQIGLNFDQETSRATAASLASERPPEASRSPSRP